MEPMTLGSPPQSPQQPGLRSMGYSSLPATPMARPSSTGVHQSSSTPIATQTAQGSSATGFLPGFLIGDYSQQGTGRVISPTKNRSVNSACGAAGGMSNQSTPVHVGGGQRINGFLTPTMPVAAGPAPNTVRTPSDKPGGPPIKGLLSTPKSNSNHHHLLHHSGTPKGIVGASTPIPTTPNLSFGVSPARQLNLSVLESVSQSTCQDGSTWVTVFGFPPSASSYILQQFSQIGTILQHHTPANGNWMKIRFQTRTQAQSALSRSGRVLGGSLMIGVAPCEESDTPLEDRGVLDQSRLASNTSVTNFNSSINTSSRSSIRPLAQVYKAAHAEQEMSIMSTSASKSDGLVSRAMEYIFGW